MTNVHAASGLLTLVERVKRVIDVVGTLVNNQQQFWLSQKLFTFLSSSDERSTRELRADSVLLTFVLNP